MWKFSVLVASVLLATFSEGQQQKSCRTIFSEQNRKQLRWINDCVKQLNYKTGREKAQKSACVQKCVLENLQLLNNEGYVDKEQYNTFLKSQFPDYMWDRANVTFEPCLHLKRNEIAGEDEFCKGIQPITKCLTRNFSNLCRGTK